MSGRKSRLLRGLIVLGFLTLLVLYHNLSRPKSGSLRIMFYNVENLFDTKNNPQKEDDDFTPWGSMRWTEPRYWKKLEDISQVIISVGGNMPPAVIGLCEVENQKVLEDLVLETDLYKYQYEFVVTNSADRRGINVGLLFRPAYFSVIDTAVYTPHIQGAVVRDIMHVVGKIGGDTLDVFVCHFPSRKVGLEKSEPQRIACAELLKSKTDSLMRMRKYPNILIMGDFNDFPDNRSIYDVIGAKSREGGVLPGDLYNLFYDNRENEHSSSYKFQDKWGCFDQFIVNGKLLDENARLSIKSGKAAVYRDSLILEPDRKYGGEKTFKTYSGTKYGGGVSDHLPIYLDLQIAD